MEEEEPNHLQFKFSIPKASVHILRSSINEDA